MPRHLVTSALPHADGVKHLGNLVGSMLPADVYSRFLRARGEQVLFVCATNDHGASAELAAADAGIEVADYCTQQHEAQARLAEEFGLSFDVFGRSSSPQNRQQTQYFARRLDEEGYLEARSTRQMFSPTDGCLLFDRCIIGTCPHCDYDHAHGDQCEECGRLLDPTELIEPRSAISGSRELELRESRHLFLLQSKLVGELRAWLESKSDWSLLSPSVGAKWLDEGVEDRSITRDLSWGIPVDWSDFEGKVYCTWFDAPIAYIGATREWADARGDPDAWREWWCATEDVRYVQFIAKENVPFHMVGFPCSIIGSRESWKSADLLKAFEWLTYYGDRFSTARGVGVFMDQAIDLLAPDYWRYYLMANSPEKDQASFSWEAFAAAVNEDLAGTFDDFVNRSLGFARRYFGDTVPGGGAAGAEEARLVAEVDAHIDELTARMLALEFRKAVAELRAAWSRGNAYFARKQPWLAVKSDPKDAALTVRTCINLIALFARLSSPLMPFTAERLLEALGVPGKGRGWPLRFDAEALGGGHEFSLPPALFRRIDEVDIGRWRARFGAPGLAANG
jgi:methionyl-tRNA synthetase